jgi:hypothetical protein
MPLGGFVKRDFGAVGFVIFVGSIEVMALVKENGGAYGLGVEYVETMASSQQQKPLISPNAPAYS